MSRAGQTMWVACEVCGCRVATPRIRKFDLWISRCLRCGFLFANPRLPREDIWRRYSAEYFRTEYLPSQGVQHDNVDLEEVDRRYASMLRLIAREKGRPGRVLEIGAGAGLFLKAAERAGWQVAGTDISEPAVQFAAERLGLSLRLEAAEDLSFPDAAFDVAVMFDVIEHLFHPLTAVRAARRTLRPGGLLVITTPNINAFSRWVLGRQWAVLSPAEHLSYFSERTLRRLLTRAGLTAVGFVRAFDGFGLHRTMNPEYTHQPGSRRARWYRGFVARYGERWYPWIRARGLGDVLLSLARRPTAKQDAANAGRSR